MDCSPTARLLFIGMLNFCDDGGNHPANNKRIKAEVFPSDDITAEEINRMVGELISSGLVSEYSHEGKGYWHVTGWHHQKIEKPSFKYPSPPAQQPIAYQSPTGRRIVDDQSPPDVEGKGKGVNRHQELRASTDPATSTAAGRVCARLRRSGITGVNPSRPDLRELLASGVTEDEIAAVGEEPAARGKGIAWVLATVIGRRKDAAEISVAKLPDKPRKACCHPGCESKVEGEVSGRPWCREHQDYAMDAANFRRVAA